MCTHVVQLVTQPIIPTYPTNYTNIPMTSVQLQQTLNMSDIVFLTNRICAKEKNEPELCKKSKELELKLKTKIIVKHTHITNNTFIQKTYKHYKIIIINTLQINRERGSISRYSK